MTGPVRSVSQAFTILRLMAKESGGMSLSEICRETGLSPSSALNLLRTLVTEGALARDEAGKRYALTAPWRAGQGLAEDGAARLIARVRPLLTRVAEAQDAAIGLWQILPRERLELVALGESGAATRIHMAEGQRQPLGSGATGRALAAAQRLDQGERARRFAQVRWKMPLDFAAWSQQVAGAARDGYAVDDGFGHPGVCSLGAVVPGDPVRFCVSASIFAGSRDAAAIAALGRALAQFARSDAFRERA